MGAPPLPTSERVPLACLILPTASLSQARRLVCRFRAAKGKRFQTRAQEIKGNAEGNQRKPGRKSKQIGTKSKDHFHQPIETFQTLKPGIRENDPLDHRRLIEQRIE